MLLVAGVLAACDTAAPADQRPVASSSADPTASPSAPTELAVAFIEDLSPEGALEHVLPAQQALELAFLTASTEEGTPPVEVVAFDTGGDDAVAADVAREIAADPRFVAAVAAPGLVGQAELVDVLGDADVPVLSLSARGAIEGARPGTWLRLVAPLEAQARALAEGVSTMRAARRGVCVVAAAPDGSTYARDVRRFLAEELVVVDVDGSADLDGATCGIALWTGAPEGGASLAPVAGGDPILVGGPGLRAPGFLQLTAAADGTTAFCSCADVSTSLDLAAQRFIQDYQSEYGTAPGPGSVEAWDAAHVLIRALRDGGTTRADVVRSLAAVTLIDGLAGSFALRGGELAVPASAVRRYRVEGGRWVAVEPASG